MWLDHHIINISLIATVDMEQRVQQFHDDTKSLATLAPVKAVKGMNTLRKFIHRNQVYTFG